jgi:hypothetical protein
VEVVGGGEDKYRPLDRSDGGRVNCDGDEAAELSEIERRARLCPRAPSGNIDDVVEIAVDGRGDSGAELVSRFQFSLMVPGCEAV